jgi:hypothetical protein
VGIVELAVDVVDMPGEELPTIELKITVEDVPGVAVPDSEPVVEPKLNVAVKPRGAVTTLTFELKIPELVLAVEITADPEGEAPVLELETAKIEAIAGIDEVKVDVVEMELENAVLEVGASPDDRIELEDTPLELDMPRVDMADENTAAIELELVTTELELVTTELELVTTELELVTPELAEEL